MRAKTLGTAAVLLIAACGQATPAPTTTSAAPRPTTTTTTTSGPPESEAEMEISSPAFAEGTTIPVEYTCDGDNVSPQLDITGIPSGASSLVLIVDDPDAPVGVWDHWVEYDIEVTGPDKTVPEGVAAPGVSGVNSWNLPGYGGPCPPSGQSHRYFFTVYALDVSLLIPQGVDSDGVRTAMEGHVLAEAATMGTYSR